VTTPSRQIVERAGPDAAVVVTSDHGVTLTGGHAGPEPEVVATPVVLSGPGLPTGTLPAMAQCDLPQLVARVLDAGPLPPPNLTVRPTLLRVPAVAACLLALATLANGVLGAALAFGASGRPHAGRLNVTVWAALALLLLGHFTAAAALAAAVLAATAFRVGRGGPVAARTTGAPLAAGVALAVGVAWMAARLAAEGRPAGGLARWLLPAAAVVLLVTAGRQAFRLPGVPAAATLAAGAATGWLLGGAGTAAAFAGGFVAAGVIGGWLESAADDGEAFAPGRSPLAAGAALAIGASLAVMTAGESLSLSTLHVSAAYEAALHGGGGLAVAVALTLLHQAVPPAGLALGLVLSARRWSAAAAGALFVGMTATLAGEAFLATALLLGSGDQRLQSLSLGGLLRSASAMVFLTGVTALALLAKRATSDAAGPNAIT
jgi:hypothetical protein